MSGAKNKQQKEEIDLAQKAAQPIDVNATYTISGRAIAELYQLIDEVPMKYAKLLLPTVAVNIEKVED